MDKLKQEEFVAEAKGFFNFYKKQIGEAARSGENIVFMSFNDLASFSHVIAEMLLDKPEEILNNLEVSLQEIGILKNPRIRLLDLPDDNFVKIRNIRAKHLNKMLWIEGIVRQASDVRPQVVSARFECPSCGTIISVLQLEKKFKEPSRCSCGRKGFFKLISKQMVDAQRLVIEESPESLIGGEQPRRLNVFLKEDLVDPKMEERTTPGSKVRVIGILSEVPVPLQTGSVSTRFDLAIDANNVIPLEESYEELKISEEDEMQIKELSMDENIFRKLTENIAPSIYGYEEVKQSLVLQLFGGIKKQKVDGTVTRGDIHILLVGDPGVAKSLGKNEKVLYFNNKEYGYDTIESLFNKFGKYPHSLKTLTIDMNNHAPKWKKVEQIIKHSPEKKLIKVTTEHGKSVIATLDHSFITLSKEGEIVPIKGSDLDKNTYLPLPINFHHESVKKLKTDKFNTYLTNSKQLPSEILLNEQFGFFIGAFLSEGYIRSDKTVNISNKNKKFKQKLINFADEIGLNVDKNTKDGILISSKSLSNLLKYYCYNLDKKRESKVKGNYSRIKKIPDFAYFAPRDFIKGLISGIFSGDGRFIKDDERIKGFELITVSKDLAHGTSDLLFSIGILNRIISRVYTYKGKKTEYYSLSVPTQMIQKFRDSFNFYGREYLSYNKPMYSYYNLLPVGELVYDLTKKLGYNRRIDGNRTFAAEMRTVEKRGEIGRLRLRKILQMFQKKTKEKMPDFDILKKIAYSPIVWSKIDKIEEVETQEEVYDLFIPGTNTFVANGIGVHNSITLKFVSKIAPKGRYVVGRGASGAGLTATVVRDEFLKGWSLEAGAMVLSNKGIVCIDEIEKMDEQDRSAMHEAMEQQCYLPNFNLSFADGSKIKIGEFVDNLIEKDKNNVINGINCEILPLNNGLKILTTDFESIYPVKIDKVSRHIASNKFVKINLNNGREVIVTPEHPCWTKKNKKITTNSAIKTKKGDPFPIVSKGKIRWSKIKSVEIIKNKDIKWVYDVTIEPNHSFISNNMVLHNSVTISKANVQASLRAETSVLAAGNPKFGRFDPYQAIAQQIDIQPTLLNRFDVIFMLRDLPEKARDEAIASHVLFEQQNTILRGSIEPELFRKYVAYAKQKIIPKLSDEAVAEIKNFYVSLRNAPTASDSPLKPIPITARQLEALVRLSEASAKTRLSPIVEKEDSLRAINLMKFYLMQAGYDYETKTFDIDKIVTGVTTSKRGKFIEVRDAIIKLESKMGKLIPMEELEKELENKINKAELDEAIEKLRMSGDIFVPKSGYIQRV
ncbi:hypothetical protein HYW74_01490 [Candidatus Pacearchaeota archaeon]|nr:hypothetical protein [Candidatus Pacearchaeota archaeon]